MARPLRVEFAGACYHVISRGNFRFPVFAEERDRERFLAALIQFAERFHVHVRAYCVQVNHFHCYLQTAEANLGSFMQSFLTSFTVSYNRRHQTSGHVFQGRYKAFLVDDDSSYRGEVSRYIHLNPACIPSLKDAPVEVRQRAIRQCPWSSYGALIGLRSCPRWLDRDAVLGGSPGQRLADRQQAYAAFVEQGLTADLWDPAAVAVAQTVIGSDSFVDRVRRATASVAEQVSVRRECGQQARLQAWCPLREVVLATAAAFGVEPRDLLLRWSRNNEARQVLLYLALEHCRGRYSATNLARRLGGISISGLAKAHRRMEARLRQDPDLRATVAPIEAAITDKSNA
jgi:REP element-mobilizing transposase RayT